MLKGIKLVCEGLKRLIHLTLINLHQRIKPMLHTSTNCLDFHCGYSICKYYALHLNNWLDSFEKQYLPLLQVTKHMLFKGNNGKNVSIYHWLGLNSKVLRTYGRISILTQVYNVSIYPSN